MRRLLIIAAVLVLTSCTPAQVRAWLRWHADEPDAAVAWLSTDEAQALLADEPDPIGVEPGDCSSYAHLFERYGLPVATFTRIAWRESGCNHLSYVHDSDDIGGGLLGLNLRAGADRWRQWCGLTTANVTDAETNVRCAAAAYDRMGMAPWAT
jgi:hypothetical protein